jgi:hypothetical protein
MAKPTSTLDVEVLLSDAVGGIRHLEKLVEVYEEKGKPNALVKPKGKLRLEDWNRLNKAVQRMGGQWKQKEALWIIPLERK